jgi:SAM-dependent methyltransferase
LLRLCRFGERAEQHSGCGVATLASFLLGPLQMALIGGWIGARAIAAIAGTPPRHDACSGDAYRDRSKLEVLLGSDIWDRLRGRVVLDFGCGAGHETLEIARHSGSLVVGLDIQEDRLQLARAAAVAAGMDERCRFTAHWTVPVDDVICTDSFEHFDEPEAALRVMYELVKPGGYVYAAFGPPWYHPYGGHLFSIFPWAHLVFSEQSLIRWRSQFKSDGATCFKEVAGGLNGMTVRRFRKLLDRSGFVVQQFETVPIRRVPFQPVGLLREFFTSIVRCRLWRPANESPAAHL